MNVSNEDYQRIYMEGYTAGLRAGKAEASADDKPFFKAKDIAERYGCGLNKAYEVMRAVRHVCDGGGFGSAGMVKRSELLYWESIVDKKYLTRISAGTAK